MHGLEESEADVLEAVEISGGDIHAALRLLQGESGQIRSTLIRFLESRTPGSSSDLKVLQPTGE